MTTTDPAAPVVALGANDQAWADTVTGAKALVDDRAKVNTAGQLAAANTNDGEWKSHVPQPAPAVPPAPTPDPAPSADDEPCD